MRPYVLITDSGSDLPQEILLEYGIEMICLGAELDGVAVDVTDTDGVKAFYNGMRDKKETKTYAANADQFMEIFESYLAKDTDILYIGFSSGLSGTYAASQIAKNMLAEKYPDSRVATFDTLCASLGQGMVVYYAAEMKKNGATIDEILNFLADFAPKVTHRFTVDDLAYLKRGGRISAATALVGTLLSIKPLLHVNDEGKLVSLKKARGRKNAIETLCEDMKAIAVNPSEHTVFISHADCIEDAETLAALVEKTLAPKKIIIGEIGPVIGAHSGPGTLALFYYGSTR